MTRMGLCVPIAVLLVSVAPDRAVGQDVIVHRDVAYGHVDGMATVYDVGRPANANGAGVIFVISGGFLSTLEQQELISPVAEPLLKDGFTIFYLRHPSTPRYLAPEIYEAVRPGVAHVLEHASDFGVEASRVGLMGMSTGGTLALLLGLDVASDAVASDGERPAAVVAYMPVVDLRDHVGDVQSTPALGFAPELAPSLSPIDFVSPDDPPVLMIHGRRDDVVPFRENSVRLQGRLVEAGVVNDLVVVDAGHELFTGVQKDTADRAVIQWFRRHLLD